MEEYLIVAHNFRRRVSVIANGQRIIGRIEMIDEDDRVLIGGQWYEMEGIEWAPAAKCRQQAALPSKS